MFKLILGGLLIALALSIGAIAFVVSAPFLTMAVTLMLGIAVLSSRK